MSRSVLLLCAVVLLALPGCQRSGTSDASPPETADLRSVVSERSVGKWPQQDRRLPRSVVSPNGIRVASVVKRGRGYAIALDGRTGQIWEQIGGILMLEGCFGSHVCGKFTDDSKHFLYWGRRGRLWHLVVDGRSGRGYPDSQREPPSLIGPVNGHYAVRVQKGARHYWVVDGREQTHYSSLGEFEFSPDGLHHAYVAWTNRGAVLVRDGKAVHQPRSDGASLHLTFSPDGKKLAFVTSVSVPSHQGTAPLIMVDEQPVFTGRAGMEVQALGFSPRWQALAWVERSRNGQVWVASGGVYGPTYPRVTSISFGPDGFGLMYIGYRADGQAELVSHGHVMSRAQDFAPIRPIRSQAWYGGDDIPTDAFTGSTNDYPMYLVKQKDRWRVEPCWPPRTEKDIKHVSLTAMAYIALRRDGKWVKVDSGGERPPTFDQPLGPLVYSPKLGRVAYAVRIGDSRLGSDTAYMVVDGELSPPAFMVSQPVFSADGEHVAYLARSRTQAWAVVDGVKGPIYDSTVRMEPPVFRENGSLQYLAVRDGKLYRITHRWE